MYVLHTRFYNSISRVRSIWYNSELRNACVADKPLGVPDCPAKWLLTTSDITDPWAWHLIRARNTVTEPHIWISISIPPPWKHEGFKNFFQTKSYTKCLLCMHGIILFLHVGLPFLEYAYFAFLMNRNGFKASVQENKPGIFFMCVTEDLECGYCPCPPVTDQVQCQLFVTEGCKEVSTCCRAGIVTEAVLHAYVLRSSTKTLSLFWVQEGRLWGERLGGREKEGRERGEESLNLHSLSFPLSGERHSECCLFMSVCKSHSSLSVSSLA